MTAQGIYNKYPILNPAWRFNPSTGRFITKARLLGGVGPFDPWNQRLEMVGCEIEEDGVGELLEWHPTAIINDEQAELTIVNDVDNFDLLQE